MNDYQNYLIMQYSLSILIKLPMWIVLLILCNDVIQFDWHCDIFYIDYLADPPYTLVYAADTMYCTVPPSITPNYEALLQHVRDVLRDHNPSTRVQLFAEGRTLFQASADYNLAPTASFKVSLSGVGILCDTFLTVYSEGTTNSGSLSGKKQCSLIGQPTNAMNTNTDCIFRCYTLIATNCGGRVTFRTVLTTWAPDAYKLSLLCDLKIWQDWYLFVAGAAGFYIFSAWERNTIRLFSGNF